MQRKSLRTSNKVALVAAAVVAALATLVTTANAAGVTVPAQTWSQTLGGKTFSATFGQSVVESTSSEKKADTKFVLTTPVFDAWTTSGREYWKYEVSVDVVARMTTPNCKLTGATISADLTFKCITLDSSGNADTSYSACTATNTLLGTYAASYRTVNNGIAPTATFSVSTSATVTDTDFEVDFVDLVSALSSGASTVLSTTGAQMKLKFALDSMQETGATFSITADAGFDWSQGGTLQSALPSSYQVDLTETINLVDKAVTAGLTTQVGDCLSDAISGKCLTIGTVTADTAANCFSADDVASPASARGTVAGAAVATLVAALAMA